MFDDIGDEAAIAVPACEGDGAPMFSREGSHYCGIMPDTKQIPILTITVIGVHATSKQPHPRRAKQ
jgi:hypothetical protein